MAAKRERARKDINLNGFFDIETEDWTTFVVGGVLTEDGAYQAYDWNHEDLFVDHLLGLKGDIWSHNGGAFDDKWLLDHMVARDIKAKVIAAGSRIIAIETPTARFLDSKALTKLTLKELTLSAEVEKQRLGLQCENREECEEDCEGYCAIHRKGMSKVNWQRLIEYLEADCRSLQAAMFRVKRHALENDLDLAMTVGASAWKNARRLLDLPSATLLDSEHMFAREAYYGGRVQVFRPRVPYGFEADVNSMYPSRLAHFPVPVGAASYLFGKDARRAFMNAKPGLFKAEVDVPEMHIPPLPYRVKQHERVSYPTGRFGGVWAGPELRYAEELGCKVYVTQALVWEREEIVFRSWVDRMFSLRANAPGGKDSSLGTFIKFYLNSLTGKFGARPDNTTVLINPDDAHPCTCPLGGCSGRCGATTPMGQSASIYSVASWRLDGCAHVEWAATLTAEARVEWHRQAVSVAGGMDMVYGDTDSVLSLQKRTRNMGKELGQWGIKGDYEGSFRQFLCVCPKVYRLREGGPKTLGKLKVKAKGLRLPKSDVAADNAIRKGELVGKDAVIGFWRGAKEGKFFTKANVSRRVSQGFGDRILENGSDYTRAPTIGEVAKAQEIEAEEWGGEDDSEM